MSTDKIIILTREDLIDQSLDHSITCYEWDDFKQSRVYDSFFSIYCKAETIIFLDGGKYHFIKNKYKQKYSAADVGNKIHEGFVQWLKTGLASDLKKAYEFYGNPKDFPIPNYTLQQKLYLSLTKDTKIMDPTANLKPFNLERALAGDPVVT